MTALQGIVLVADSCDSRFHWGHSSIKTQKMLSVLSKRTDKFRHHILLFLTLQPEGEISEKNIPVPLKHKQTNNL